MGGLRFESVFCFDSCGEVMNKRIKATIVTSSAVALLMAIGLPSHSGAPKTAPSSTTTSYGVSARTTDLKDIIRYFDGNHSYMGDVYVGTDFTSAAFIAGNWVPSSAVSALALTQDDALRVRGSFLASDGSVAQSINFGKEEELSTLMGLNYDGDAVTDLAVLPLDGRTVTIYLNPGISGTAQAVKVPVDERVDIVRLFQNGPDELGFVKRTDLLTPQSGTKKKKKKKKKNRRPRGGSNQLTYTDIDGSRKTLEIPQEFAEYVPIIVEGRALAFARVRSKRVEVMGASVTPRSFNKLPTDYIFPGAFSGSGNSTTLLKGSLLGDYSILNPMTGSIAAGKIPLQGIAAQELSAATTTPVTAAATGDICAEYARLLQVFLDAVTSGNAGAAGTAYAQIQALGSGVNDCDVDPGNVGGGEGGGGGSINQRNDIFRNGIGSFIPDSFLFKSNTGDFYGQCDEFFPAPDGNMGFLAKNSDFHPGAVYLTPGAGYNNGRILDPKSLKTIGNAEYAGVANGGRSHFRVKSRPLPRGNHVFAADHTYKNETHCWRVPDGSTRVD
jgi:hypothetical protein